MLSPVIGQFSRNRLIALAERPPCGRFLGMGPNAPSNLAGGVLNVFGALPFMRNVALQCDKILAKQLAIRI